MARVDVVIGADESGTGAFAGPVYTGAVATEVVPFNSAIGRYLRDSKKLSDAKRRRAVPLIQQHAIAWCVREAPVDAVNRDLRRAWRWAMLHAVMDVHERLGADPRTLIIDGPADKLLVNMLRNVTSAPLRFEPEADNKYPAVMAAAILAKTARNDAMVALSAECPEFGWERNAGYGTPEHIQACREHGVTKHHRKIRSLRGFCVYDPKPEWFGVDGASMGEAEAGAVLGSVRMSQ